MWINSTNAGPDTIRRPAARTLLCRRCARKGWTNCGKLQDRNPDMIEAEKANYNLQLRYVELAKARAHRDGKLRRPLLRCCWITKKPDTGHRGRGRRHHRRRRGRHRVPVGAESGSGARQRRACADRRKAAGTALGMRIVATGTASATKRLPLRGQQQPRPVPCPLCWRRTC